jgi:hypothetical protein
MYNCRAGAASVVPAVTSASSNLVTELDDVYPVPNMLYIAAKAAACTVFSKIDLRKGYLRSLTTQRTSRKPP